MIETAAKDGQRTADLSDIGPRDAPSSYVGPRGFHWMIPGRFAGAARPGLFNPLEVDLNALRRVGTDVLYTLTEEWEIDPAAVEAAGMIPHHVPIPDREPPSLEEAVGVCLECSVYAAENRTVTFHCHAGRGRTGTLLVAQLIWRGMSATEAVAFARSRNREWVESESQMAWLSEFEAHCAEMARLQG